MIYNLKISKPIQKNNIVVFFLKNFEISKYNYLNFNEGLRKNKIGVEEYDNVGYRDLLNIKNLSDESLLLLNGEQIIGHKIKQNRVVASTSLIEKNSEGIIRVSCGEKNRWYTLFYIINFIYSFPCRYMLCTYKKTIRIGRFETNLQS